MDTFLMSVILVCAIIVTIIVIMQPSKDGGLGGLASGGVTGSALGVNRNEFLSKTTWWIFAIFLLSSIALARHQTKEMDEKRKNLTTPSVVEEEDGVNSPSDKPSIEPKDGVDKKVEDALKDVKDAGDKATEDLKKDVEEIEKEIEGGAKEIEEKTDDAKQDLIENLKKDGLQLDSGSDK